MSTRHTGKIKWFNETRGYGFVERLGDTDLFLHIRQVRGAVDQRKLAPGDTVSYEIGKGSQDRTCAVNVIIQLRASPNSGRVQTP